MRVRLPKGIAAQAADGSAVTPDQQADAGASCGWTLPPVAPGHTVDVRLRLATDGGAKGGLHLAVVEVGGTAAGAWTLPVAISITVGPELLEDNSFPTFGEYVVYAPRYILRLSKRYGTSRFLHDDANRPRCEATFSSRRPTAGTAPDALPRMRVEDRDALAWGDPADYLWPNTAPASVTVGTGRSRITWSFEDDAIGIQPVALWSAEAPHEFIFPGERFGWTLWGGKPEWLRIIAEDEAGKEQVLTEPPAKDQAVRFRAAALHVPGYDEAICFAADRPQTAPFDGAGIRISVNPGQPLWFGLARPKTFETWRQSRIEK